MHLTRAVVIGRVTSAGPKLKYDERATPTCTFWLDVEESGKEGQTRHSYIPVEIIGKHSESVAESLESGMECLVEGRLAYRKASGKGGKEKAGLVGVSWYVTIATPALTRPVAELPAEGMIGIDIVHGQVIVTLPDAVLVCTKQEFIEVLSAWRRAMASLRDPHASRGRVSVLARACEGNGNRLM